MASMSKRVAFVKMKNRSRNQARPGPKLMVEGIGGAGAYVTPMLAKVLQVAEHPREWWDGLLRPLLAAVAIIGVIGGAVYVIAAAGGFSRGSYYKPLPTLDSPARRGAITRDDRSKAAYPGNDGPGTAANRQLQTDESFLASAHVRERPKAETGLQTPSSQASTGATRASGGVRYQNGECLVDLRPGAITAADIGSGCLRYMPRD